MYPPKLYLGPTINSRLWPSEDDDDEDDDDVMMRMIIRMMTTVMRMVVIEDIGKITSLMMRIVTKMKSLASTNLISIF